MWQIVDDEDDEDEGVDIDDDRTLNCCVDVCVDIDIVGTVEKKRWVINEVFWCIILYYGYLIELFYLFYDCKCRGSLNPGYG